MSLETWGNQNQTTAPQDVKVSREDMCVRKLYRVGRSTHEQIDSEEVTDQEQAVANPSQILKLGLQKKNFLKHVHSEESLWCEEKNLPNKWTSMIFVQVPVKSEMFWSCCSHSPVPPSNPKTTATISSTLPKTTTNPKSQRFLFQSGSFLLFSLHQNHKTQHPKIRHHPLQPPTQSPTPQDKVGPQWSNPLQGQASLLLKDSTPTFYRPVNQT